MNFGKLNNNDGFKVIPVSTNIFILLGGPATGKSHFSRLVYNAVVVDDVHSTRVSEVRDSVIHFQEIYNKTEPGMVLLLITNDPMIIEELKQTVEFVLSGSKKCGGVCDCASGVCSR
jgi:predicted PilT family ATPase